MMIYCRSIQRTLLVMVALVGLTQSAIADPWSRLDRRFYRYHMMSNLRAERHQLQTLYPSPVGLWLAGHIDTALLPGGRLDQLIGRGNAGQGQGGNGNNGSASPMTAITGPSNDTELQRELRKNKVVLEKLLSDLSLPTNAAAISASRPGDGSAPVDGAPVDGAPVDGAPVNGAPVNGAPVDGM